MCGRHDSPLPQLPRAGRVPPPYEKLPVRSLFGFTWLLLACCTGLVHLESRAAILAEECRESQPHQASRASGPASFPRSGVGLPTPAPIHAGEIRIWALWLGWTPTRRSHVELPIRDWQLEHGGGGVAESGRRRSIGAARAIPARAAPGGAKRDRGGLSSGVRSAGQGRRTAGGPNSGEHASTFRVVIGRANRFEIALRSSAGAIRFSSRRLPARPRLEVAPCAGRTRRSPGRGSPSRWPCLGRAAGREDPGSPHPCADRGFL